MDYSENKKITKEYLSEFLTRARFLLTRTYKMVQEEKLFLDILHLILEFYQKYEKYLLQIMREEGIITKRETLNKVDVRRILIAKQEKIEKLLNKQFDLEFLFSQKSHLQELLEAQKHGPADFVRKKEYIICVENYKVEVINEYCALQMLQIAEKFWQLLS